MIHILNNFALTVDYSLLENLTSDPKAKEDGVDHSPRQVFSGHYVPVVPTPIPNPIYIAHSATFFRELGLDDTMAHSHDFIQMFSGDLSNLPNPLRKMGWATGYALSIYGSEYYSQCPFGTGNGYGDGRAISIYEGNLNGKHWEMQLKGGGATPYCRGADGRAVLRSSIREFLAQEYMNALGIPTSRSLCLYTSKNETVRRPWFREESHSRDPEVMILEDVAITTRVAPSFLRVGQIELFGRRARKNEHPNAMQELETIVLHLIDREYSDNIDSKLPLEDKLLLLAKEFRNRLTSLITNWIRVGYCQGNFNSDNCAAGGFTLDYGPFGFIELFDPNYQPWTGGGEHFSFFNQPNAAKRNFDMLCLALQPLLESNSQALSALEEINKGFLVMMSEKIEAMWAKKLGLESVDSQLVHDLFTLMIQTGVDYTIFFRELSSLPQEITPLLKSFYYYKDNNETIMKSWSQWLESWNTLLPVTTQKSREELSQQMKRINPKYTLREWFLVSTYQKGQIRDYSLILELQEVMLHPYDEQSSEIEEKYYQKKPSHLFDIAGVSHISCSS